MFTELKNNKTDGSYIRDMQSLDIPYEKCEYGKNFFYSNEEELKLYEIGRYYCPTWRNLTLQGHWNAPFFKNI